MNLRRPTMLFPLAAALCAPMLAAGADDAAPGQITLEQAVERVQKDTDGRILAAEEVHIGKKKLYRVKVLTHDGRVRVVQTSADVTDAATDAPAPDRHGGGDG